jgi:hypothetical protein
MTMRTLECNVCGEPLTGHDDEALAQRLVAHHADAHADAPPLDEESARQQVSEEAYSASDN